MWQLYRIIEKENDERSLCTAIKQCLKISNSNDRPTDINEIREEFSTNGYTIEADEENRFKRRNNRSKLQLTSSDEPKICAFCKNNGRSPIFYMSHYLKDEKGRVTCPFLRTYVCPICGSTGENAHTVRKCSKRKIITIEETINWNRRNEQKQRGNAMRLRL